MTSLRDMGPEEKALYHYAESKKLAKSAVEEAWLCGRELSGLREECGHGEWGPMMDRLRIPLRTANKYIAMFRNNPQGPIEGQSIEKMLNLDSKPPQTDEQRRAAAQRKALKESEKAKAGPRFSPMRAPRADQDDPETQIGMHADLEDPENKSTAEGGFGRTDLLSDGDPPPGSENNYLSGSPDPAYLADRETPEFRAPAVRLLDAATRAAERKVERQAAREYDNERARELVFQNEILSEEIEELKGLVLQLKAELGDVDVSGDDATEHWRATAEGLGKKLEATRIDLVKERQRRAEAEKQWNYFQTWATTLEKELRG